VQITGGGKFYSGNKMLPLCLFTPKNVDPNSSQCV